MGLINACGTQAEAEARRGGEETPGPEHLLLAVTTMPDGTASRALERVGIDRQRLRTANAHVHASALAAVGIEAEHSLGGSAELRGPVAGAFRSTPQLR